MLVSGRVDFWGVEFFSLLVVISKSPSENLEASRRRPEAQGGPL